jgi:hypothetical protein
MGRISLIGTGINHFSSELKGRSQLPFFVVKRKVPLNKPGLFGGKKEVL